MKKQVDVKELIAFLKKNRYNFYDVSVIIGGYMTSYHCISYRKQFIYDEDSLDELIKWTETEFLEAYKDSTWVIENYKLLQVT